MKGTVYISGPMAGKPDFNAAEFHKADLILHKGGWTVVNPVVLDGENDTPDGVNHLTNEVTVDARAAYLRRDLSVLLASCSSIAVLPGWRNSRGATVEVAVAVAVGMPVLEFVDWDSDEPEVRNAYLMPDVAAMVRHLSEVVSWQLAENLGGGYV